MILNGDGSTTTCNAKMIRHNSIGNFLETNSLNDLWNSDKARDIRRSIADQSFKYCDLDICRCPWTDVPDNFYDEMIENDFYLEKGPKWLRLAYDKSCNLACETCRTGVFMETKERQDVFNSMQQRLIGEDILADLEQLHLSTAGELLASKSTMSVVKKISEKKHPDLEVIFLTNGVTLTKKNLKKLENILYAVKIWFISFDAATQETYKRIRVGSDWNKLLDNVRNLCSLRDRYGFKVRINMVVQSGNYKEIPAFIKLGEELDVDIVYFQKLIPFIPTKGNRKMNENFDYIYKERAVHEEWHPENKQFFDILKAVQPTSRVHWTNLTPYVNLAKRGHNSIPASTYNVNKWCRLPQSHVEGNQELILHPNDISSEDNPEVLYRNISFGDAEELIIETEAFNKSEANPGAIVKVSIEQDDSDLVSSTVELKPRVNERVAIAIPEEIGNGDIRIMVSNRTSAKSNHAAAVRIEPFSMA